MVLRLFEVVIILQIPGTVTLIRSMSVLVEPGNMHAEQDVFRLLCPPSKARTPDLVMWPPTTGSWEPGTLICSKSRLSGKPESPRGLAQGLFPGG